MSGNPYTRRSTAASTTPTPAATSAFLAAAALGPAPGFFQADARLDKRFVFRNWMMSVYLDVQNVTNRENAEFRFPSYDCSAVSIPSIPVLPALGLRAEW